MTVSDELLNKLKSLKKTDKDYSQKRMKLMVEYLQVYMSTYDKQTDYENYSDSTLIHDILYGLGVVIDPEEHQWALGYEKWKGKLKDFLLNNSKR